MSVSEKLRPTHSEKTLRTSLRFDIDFQDLFLRSENRENMVPGGMQSEDLRKIHPCTETRKPRASSLKKDWTKFRVVSVASSSTMRSWLTMVCSMPRPFTMTSYSKQFLVQAWQVAKPTKLWFKLTNIQLEYEMVRSKRERKNVSGKRGELAQDDLKQMISKLKERKFFHL